MHRAAHRQRAIIRTFAMLAITTLRYEIRLGYASYSHDAFCLCVRAAVWVCVCVCVCMYVLVRQVYALQIVTYSIFDNYFLRIKTLKSMHKIE